MGRSCVTKIGADSYLAVRHNTQFMNESVSSSISMDRELGEWLAQQSRIRDTTASALMRAALRRMQAEIALGIEPPVGWPFG